MAALQTRVAEAVLRQLSVMLRTVSPFSNTPKVRIDRQAHAYYAKGLFHWNRHTPLGWSSSVDMFRRSIAEDPSFAPAFAGLAHATYCLTALQGIIGIGDYLTIKDATARALSLDPNLADAHAIDARLKWTPEWDLHAAGIAYRRSLDLNSSAPDVNTWYALYLLAIGRRDDALRHAEVAMECDPVTVAAHHRLAMVLYNARLYDDAIKTFTDALDLEPSAITTQTLLGCTYVAAGQPQRGIDVLMRAAGHDNDNSVVMAVLTWALSKCGRRAEADEVLMRLLRKREVSAVPAVYIAWGCAAMGRTEEAFDWLERAVQERCLELIGLQVEPMFDTIREDHRFRSIVASIGLLKSP